MAERAHPGHLRHLARTARPTAAGATAPPERHRPATGQLPDAEALVLASHHDRLDGPALARAHQTSPRALYAHLEAHGRSRYDLWRPPRKPRGRPRDEYGDDPRWAALVRDYRAGDATLTLEARYGIPQQTIARRLAADPDVTVRSKPDGVALRTRQTREADEIRYRLRTGALDAAAASLGMPADRLRAVLDAHGLILHDLTEPED